VQITLTAASSGTLNGWALQPITLEIQSGEQVAVIGPSGAGKTTLLHLMACALPLHEGRIELDASDPWALSPRELQQLRGDLFLAPQVPPLPARQRVVTSVLAGQLPRMGFWQSLRSLFYPVDIPAVRAALAAFNLSDKLWDRVDRLSGGERQRVGLARSLVSDAKLWLIDEPLSALDPKLAAQVMITIKDAAKAKGATLVVSLHQVEVALANFPRILGLRDGALIFDLPPSKVTPAILQNLYAQHLDELSH